jgi:AcrR family transcriptional regulator
MSTPIVKQVRRTQEERRAATRAALIAAGRRLFGERGFAGVAIEEIAAEAGVTRGALYHHFEDKRALFREVFEDVERSLVPTMAGAASPENDAWTNLLAGCSAFLDACLERDVQQIVLIDGPSVLGWDEWRTIEDKYGLALVSAGLMAVMAAGFIKQQPVGPLAHLLLAAINEAGLVIARAPDVSAARAEVGATLEGLLEGLRA